MLNHTRRRSSSCASNRAAGIYPAGPLRFATLCGDGTTLLVKLDPEGAPIATERSDAFFDVIEDPVMMAEAMKHAIKAGRMSYLAGRMARKMYADPSSPLAGLI